MKSSINKVKLLAKTETVQDTLIMFLGGGLTTGLGFIFTVILARSLSVANLGLFITSFTFIQLVSEVFEAGTNASVFNFVSSSSGEERSKFVKATFISKLLIGFVIACLVFLLSNLITNLFFKDPAMLFYVRFAAIGIFFSVLIAWGQTVLKAERRFMGFVINNLTVNTLRIFSILILTAVGLIDPQIIYLVLVVAPILTLALLAKQLSLDFLKVKISQKLYGLIWKFSLPVGVSFACSALYTTIDQILVLNISGAREAGIYGLAYKVASIIILSASILGNVITPRYASLENKYFFNYFKKSLLMSGGLGVVSLVSIFIAPYLLPLFFGNKFLPSVLPFQILSAGAIMYLLSIPFSYAILYKFKNLYFMMYAAICYLALLWVLLNGLIPIFGSVGAALAVTIVFGLQLIASISYFSYLCLKKE